MRLAGGGVGAVEGRRFRTDGAGRSSYLRLLFFDASAEAPARRGRLRARLRERLGCGRGRHGDATVGDMSVKIR